MKHVLWLSRSIFEFYQSHSFKYMFRKKLVQLKKCNNNLLINMNVLCDYDGLLKLQLTVPIYSDWSVFYLWNWCCFLSENIEELWIWLATFSYSAEVLLKINCRFVKWNCRNPICAAWLKTVTLNGLKKLINSLTLFSVKHHWQFRSRKLWLQVVFCQNFFVE